MIKYGSFFLGVVSEESLYVVFVKRWVCHTLTQLRSKHTQMSHHWSFYNESTFKRVRYSDTHKPSGVSHVGCWELFPAEQNCSLNSSGIWLWRRSTAVFPKRHFNIKASEIMWLTDFNSAITFSRLEWNKNPHKAWVAHSAMSESCSAFTFNLLWHSSYSPLSPTAGHTHTRTDPTIWNTSS